MLFPFLFFVIPPNNFFLIFLHTMMLFDNDLHNMLLDV